MDMLAEKMGIDPLRAPLTGTSTRPGKVTTPTGQVPEVFCMEGAASTLLRPKYEEAKKRCKQLYNVPEKARGVGLALGIYGCGLDGPDGSEAAVELLPDGGVTVYNAWQDHGQGADLGTLTMAHEALRPLGIKPSRSSWS